MSGPLSANRIKQTTTTTGTGTLNLDATIANTYKSFVSGISSGNTCYFCIAHQTLDEWEVALGTVTSGTPDTLSRTTVLASSTGSAVSFSAGIKDVFLVTPADYGSPIIRIPGTDAVRILKEVNTVGAIVGNARGNLSIDFQQYRDNAQQVPSGNYSTITGGTRNRSVGDGNFIGGGNANYTSGSNSTVGGGGGNRAQGKFATVGGGIQNTADRYGTVAGGYGCVAGVYATCAGGFRNTASGAESFCGSGGHNVASQNYTTTCGGRFNTSSANYAALCGGKSNTASGNYSIVGSGLVNLASSSFAGILGGYRAVANKYGQQSQASGRFNNDGDAQTSSFVLRQHTIDATATEMFLDGSSTRMILSNNTTWGFNISVVARRTNATGENAYFFLQGAIVRDANAAATAIVGSVIKNIIARDMAAWDVNVTADTTNGSLKITVTGEAAKNIQWVACVRTVETSQ